MPLTEVIIIEETMEVYFLHNARAGNLKDAIHFKPFFTL